MAQDPFTDVQPMAVNNVSIDQVAAFADCAAQGGNDIQKVVAGCGIQFEDSFEELCCMLKAVWFEED